MEAFKQTQFHLLNFSRLTWPIVTARMEKPNYRGADQLCPAFMGMAGSVSGTHGCV